MYGQGSIECIPLTQNSTNVSYNQYYMLNPYNVISCKVHQTNTEQLQCYLPPIQHGYNVISCKDKVSQCFRYIHSFLGILWNHDEVRINQLSRWPTQCWLVVLLVTVKQPWQVLKSRDLTSLVSMCLWLSQMYQTRPNNIKWHLFLWHIMECLISYIVLYK